MDNTRIFILLDELGEVMNRSIEDSQQPLLDLRTGMIVYEPDPELTGIDDPDLARALDDEPERFRDIPRIEGREIFEWMAAFADTVDEDDVRRRLGDALSGGGAFGRFRGVLRDYPDLQAQWFASLNERLVEEATGWLDREGIQYKAQRREAPPARSVDPREKKLELRVAHVLLLGTPGVVDGRVRRTLDAGARNPRELFKVLARDLCAMNGVEWRKRFIEGKTTFELEGTRVSCDDRAVHVDVELTPEIRALFHRT